MVGIFRGIGAVIRDSPGFPNEKRDERFRKDILQTVIPFPMKHLADQAAICRKTLRNAGLSVNGTCSEIKGDGSQKAEELARTVSQTIDDCTRCRKRHSHQNPDDRHTAHVIVKTQKTLREGLAKIESDGKNERNSR